MNDFVPEGVWDVEGEDEDDGEGEPHHRHAHPGHKLHLKSSSTPKRSRQLRYENVRNFQLLIL